MERFASINIQGNIISAEILDRIRTEDIKYQQQPSDFGLGKKTTVRDEIGVAWAAARAHWTAFRLRLERLDETNSAKSETRNSWMIPLLRELGYNVEKVNAWVNPETQKQYAISHAAANIGSFPIMLMGYNQKLDSKPEDNSLRMSPHGLTQEYLNHTEHTYALVSNGRFLRLLRDASRLVRSSYLEFDLERMMEQELYADFAILFRTLHATRMPKHPDEVEDSYIEYYHQESLSTGSRIRNELSSAVKESIKILANGFLSHPGNKDLCDRVKANSLSAKDLYQLQLRLIYRFLFLIVTEERNLVYADTKDETVQRMRKIYYDNYSIERLRRLAARVHYVDGRKHDLWEGLKATFHLFEKARYGEKLGIKPLGAGLFSPEKLGTLPNQKLDNKTLLKVIYLLTWFKNEQGNVTRVNYRDLGVEEFGSVYEGLLELEGEYKFINGQPEFYFVPGKERSKDGAHYTPEELVKPLIKHSLEYIIEEKLKEKDKEKALLSIRVCDVACGSGHILLSAARRIGQELARVRTGEDQPPQAAEMRATRDVIKHCIYGVDKNPLAVELCKVALWLEAHNPGEPLSFLDHHIRWGNAIVGLAHKEDLQKGIADEAFKTLPGDDKAVASAFLKRNKQERKNRPQLEFNFEGNIDDQMTDVMKAFNKIVEMPERTPDDIEKKENAYTAFLKSDAVKRLRLLADIQLAPFFVPKTAQFTGALATDALFFRYLRGESVPTNTVATQAAIAASYNDFFHWFLEFPDVFKNGGFDCILGNPPYLGGQKLSGFFGNTFLEYVKYAYSPIGAVDLVTYFFRRIYDILNSNGFQSLISTNTIAQGSAREGGLDVICSQGGVINHAVRSMRWPGRAAVEVSLITIHKGQWNRDIILDNKKVERITPYLDDSEVIGNPFPLKQNAGKSFQGSIVLGKGFVLTPEEAEALIARDSRNKDVLFPYLNGDDLNNDPQQKPSRWVINFFDWSEEKARAYPDCFDIVERLVKPERMEQNDKGGKEKWWKFLRPRNELYETISKLDQVMVMNRYTKYTVLDFQLKNTVFSDSIVVFALDSFYHFAILSSSIHDIWAWKNSSTMGASTLRYSPTNAFETFPLPLLPSMKVEKLGRSLNKLRKSIMSKAGIGLTELYNMVHDPKFSISDHLYMEIIALRTLHVDLDMAVVEAYEWCDLSLEHNFYELEYLPENDRVRYTINSHARKEILKRLLIFNHKFFTEETPVNKHKAKSISTSANLFSEEKKN